MSETKKAKAPVKAQALYTLEALREDCINALGIEKSTFDGAFASVPNTASFTLSEAKAHVDAWLKRPVKIRR